MIFFFILFFNSVNVFSQSSDPNLQENPLYSPADLKSDFLLFRQVLEEVHPGLYWYSAKERMNYLFDSTYTYLNKPMTEVEFYKLLANISAQIHCGHTLVDPSYVYQDQGSRFPFDLKFIRDKAYILYNYSEFQEIKPGSELLKINGLEMKEILSLMMPYLPADAFHPAGKYQCLEEDFQNYYDLWVGRQDTFLLEYIDLESKKKVVKKIPASEDDNLRSYNKRYIEELKEEMLDLKMLEEENAALLTIHSFLPFDIKHSRQKYHKFIKAAFRTIQSKKTSDLIIDLRKNAGGEMLYANELFSYLADTMYRFLDRVEVTTDKINYLDKYKPFMEGKVHNPRRVSQTDSGTYVVSEKYYTFLEPQKPKKNNFKGNVYILISKKSFSAAGLFCAMAYHRGVLVGEETGAGANGLNGGDFIDIVLPKTKILLEIPIEKWVRKIPGYAHQKGGILPHHLVEPKIEDIISGKDTVLDKTLELIRNSRSAEKSKQ